MVCSARRPLRTRGTIGNVPGRSSDHPVGPRPVSRTLSRPVISFEPPMQGWLAEAINGLLGQEALEDKGDYRKRSVGGSLDHPVGPRPHPGPCLTRLSHFNLQHGDSLQRPSMVCWARRPLRTRETIEKVQGRSLDDPVGPRPVPQTCLALLSHLNLQYGDGSQSPSMVFWARRPLRTRGTIENVSGRSPDHPVGPRLIPRVIVSPRYLI